MAITIHLTDDELQVLDTVLSQRLAGHELGRTRDLLTQPQAELLRRLQLTFTIKATAARERQLATTTAPNGHRQKDAPGQQPLFP